MLLYMVANSRSPRRRLYEPEARAGWSPVSIERDRFLSNKPKSSLKNGVSRALPPERRPLWAGGRGVGSTLRPVSPTGWPAMPKRWSSLENLYGIISSTQSPIGNMSSLSPLCAVSTSSMTGAYLQGYATVLMIAYSSFYEMQ